MSTLAPPEFREYIEYNVEVFKATDVAMKIISSHTRKLAEAAENTAKLSETIGTTEINVYSGRESLKFRDTEKYLNSLYIFFQL